MVMIMNCIFCDIVNKKKKADILYEDDLIIVIMDAFPNVDGHILIIPKIHYNDYQELDDKLLLHINKIAKKYGAILMKKLKKESLTILVNYGKSQMIKHYHLHLLPDFPSLVKLNKDEVFNILK